MLGSCGQFGQSGLARLQSVPQCWYLELVSVASKGYMVWVKLLIIFYEKKFSILRVLWSVWSVWSGMGRQRHSV